MKNLFYSLILSFSLSGCIPAAFTTATIVSVNLSKSKTIGKTIDDIKISSFIKKEFLKQGLRDLYSKIKVEVANKRVLYIGTVSNQKDIITAINIAWQQNDVKEVINELTVSQQSNYFDIKQYTKDSFITAQVKTKLMLDSKIKFVNYTITTFNNIVYLFGISRSQEESDRASDIAAKVPGVQEVVNHMKQIRTNVNNLHSTPAKENLEKADD